MQVKYEGVLIRCAYGSQVASFANTILFSICPSLKNSYYQVAMTNKLLPTTRTAVAWGPCCCLCYCRCCWCFSCCCYCCSRGGTLISVMLADGSNALMVYDCDKAVGVLPKRIDRLHKYQSTVVCVPYLGILKVGPPE
jgi:hypothetical protein